MDTNRGANCIKVLVQSKVSASCYIEKSRSIVENILCRVFGNVSLEP